MFVGAPIFPREFEQNTHVFALTQSVRRLRWWAIKVTVATVPLVLGLLALGFVMQWVDASYEYTSHNAMDYFMFTSRGMMPAVYGLVAIAIAVTAGIVTRHTVAALVTSLVVATVAVLVLAEPVQQHVLPAERYVAAIGPDYQGGYDATPFQNDPDAAGVGRGYLDAQGGEIQADYNGCANAASQAAQKGSPPQGPTDTAAGQPMDPDVFTQTAVRCMRDQGAVSGYTDYLPGSMLWPLRWTMTGICGALAALFLAAGAWRLRAAISKR